MALNDIMARVAQQHIEKQPRGMQFSRFQLDRILEALHIPKARRQEQYRHGEERDSKSTRQRTIRQMIIDYDHLIDIINTKIQ